MFKFIVKHKKIFFSLIILALISIITVTAFMLKSSIVSDSPELMKAMAPKYRTAEAVKGDIVKLDYGAGTIIPSNAYNLYFDASNGNLKSLLKKQGEVVKPGEFIAELDYLDMHEQIKEKEISLEIAKLNYQKLITTNANTFEIKKAALIVESAKLDLEYLRQELSKKKLISPVGGMVTYRISSKLGGEVNGSDIIYTISDIKDIQIQYFGKYIWELPVGKKVSIMYKGKNYSGKVISEPLLRKTGKTMGEKYYYVYIKFDNMPKDYSIGDSVNISIEVDRKSNVIRIPKNAIMGISGDYYITILENESKITKKVNVGLAGEVDIEITQGLNEGERVILN